MTTLAAAGTPVALAYVGSRTLKPVRAERPDRAGADDRRRKAASLQLRAGHRDVRGDAVGCAVAFSTKALFWNKDIFTAAGLDPKWRPRPGPKRSPSPSRSRIGPTSTSFGVVAKTFDNTMHQFLHWVYTNDGLVIDADGNIVLNSPQVLEALTALKDISAYSKKARPPTSRTKCGHVARRHHRHDPGLRSTPAFSPTKPA